MLTPRQEDEFAEYRKSSTGKFFKLIVGEEIEARLNAFIAALKEAGKPPEMYTINDICAMLKVTPATLHNWKKQGLLTGCRLGKNRYFTKQEVEQAMTKYKIGNGNPEMILESFKKL